MSVFNPASFQTPSPRARLVRRVFYIPGYAPEGAARHRDLFAREAQRFASLWKVDVQVSALQPGTGGVAACEWRARTRMSSAEVETFVETLAWDDLVAADFRKPLVAKLTKGFAALLDALVSGTLFRVARAAPWFAFGYVYPYLWLLGCVAAGAAGGVVASWLAPAGFGLALGLAAGAAVAYGALKALHASSTLYAIHLLDDWIAQRRYRRRADPALDDRLDGFAERIVRAAAESADDEIVVVGHSSGSFLAIDVMARAFEADPELGRRGPAITLLTVGTAELLVAFHPGAGWFRQRLARLARERSLYWAEVAGYFDVLNFARRSPVEELGLAGGKERPNPRFRRVKINALLNRPTVLRLATRLKVFRLHFQFVMANERKAGYDFFSLMCGARTAAEQFSRPPGEPMDPFPAAAPARFAPTMTVL
ncbi:MAG TPA: hypothetical protein VGC51_05280 [Hansschlegelia sp.]